MNDTPEQKKPDLPEMTAAEKALVAKYPMPKGQPDALVNKKLLAAALDVSATTIDSWLLQGLPYQTKGTNGAAYQFRLSVAFAWRADRETAEEAERRHSEEAAAQLRMTLAGGSAQDAERARLSPKQQKEVLEVEYQYMRAARERRELIPANEVAETCEKAFVVIRDGFDAFPDELGRELNLTAEQIETVQGITDEVLREAAQELEKILTGSD